MKTIDDVFAALQIINVQAEERHNSLVAKLDQITTKINNLEVRVSKIESADSQKSNDLLAIKSDLNSLRQLNLSEELLIKGVPELERETSDEIKCVVQQILEKLGIFDISLITFNRRIGKPQAIRSRSILIGVPDNELRQKILVTKRKTSIRLEQLIVRNKCLGDKNKIVYIDENLTPMNHHLLKLARDLKKQNLVKYVWVKNGRILIR